MAATLTGAIGRSNRLLSGLSPRERARLESYLEPVELTFRQIVVKADAPIPYVVFPDGAVVSAVTELPEGELVEVGVIGSDGAAGLGLLFGHGVSSTTALVQVPGRASRMRAADFREQVVEPRGEAFQLLLRYATAFTAVLAQIAACNASHTVEQRFARWLLLVADRAHREHFSLTHEFAALLLGVRRAGVTEVANRLRVAGAIDYRAGDLRIRDRAVLQGAACGCYGAVDRVLHEPFAPDRLLSGFR